MSRIKYLTAYLVPLFALYTFHVNGVLAFLGLFIFFVVIPILELIISPDQYNFTKVESELAKDDPVYDFILYMTAPILLYTIFVFLNTIGAEGLSIADIVARVLMMGLTLAAIGINVGHDLGHKTKSLFKQIVAQIMLTSAVQNHFMPYHNGGHHKDVGTPEDFTSAKRGDNYYLFAIRSQIGGYFKTWNLESKRLKSQGKNPYFNPMIWYTFLPLVMLTGIYLIFGPFVFLMYFFAAIYGISVLEAQNYFAHYGLRRNKNEDGRYESVKPIHSWNSDHILGRVLFFELTRHSDHHYNGAKPYQVLDSREESPMLPFGYPMMLLLSYVPFAFRPIMDRQLSKYGMLN
jgi:alkane 1-monooxygenase